MNNFDGELTKYDVWYARRPDFEATNSANGYRDTHILLGTFEAEDLEDLYTRMQGENWSPNGEARELIESKGLTHTSMSVGDIAIISGVIENQEIFEVGSIGWNALGTVENPRVDIADANICPHCRHLDMDIERGKKQEKGIFKLTCSKCGGKFHYEVPK